MFRQEDYWPYIVGIFVFAGLIGIPLVWSQIVDLPLPRLLAASLVACGVFAFAHTRDGRFLVGRFLMGAVFVFVMALRAAAQADGAVVVLPGGIIGILIMVGGGWLGILLARAFGITAMLEASAGSTASSAPPAARATSQAAAHDPQAGPVASEAVSRSVPTAVTESAAGPVTPAGRATSSRIRVWLTRAAVVIAAIIVASAIVDDYGWPDPENGFFRPGERYERVAAAERRFSLLRPWGVVRPTLQEVWYLNRRVVHLGDHELLLELVKYSRGGLQFRPMRIDLAGTRCGYLGWQDNFEDHAARYARAEVQRWEPCGTQPLMQDTLKYLRSTYAGQVQRARDFGAALVQRLATDPSADDINLVSFVLTQVNQRTPDLSGRYRLLCRALQAAESSGKVFVGRPEIPDDNPYDVPWFDEIARRHGRVTITDKAGCLTVSRVTVTWSETAETGPAQEFVAIGGAEKIYLHDATARGALEVRDRGVVLERRAVSSSEAWSSFQVDSSMLGTPSKDAQGRVHYTKEADARASLHEQAQQLELPTLMTIAAPLERTPSEAMPRLQQTVCHALARIVAGDFRAGLDLIDRVTRNAEPADRPYLGQVSAYLEGKPRAGAAMPVCGPEAGVYTGE